MPTMPVNLEQNSWNKLQIIKYKHNFHFIIALYEVRNFSLGEL